ncbi:MAG: 3-deoxy-manno-octulosonate cytidylyltransferase [Gammaproteobacteria bacterium]|nr:3-deoxy-manno-octulosonate cytidylyltransferase [Gammaproteobacteria bacterium]MCP4088768.1 3-deoxy-manno-octulosonate cytidylyltransferase [Gammaproteobacteria bacterium]MCP4275933.1 3-deoxy-manno-octulosonate cytidylyltransferase [Gammaproteobacteria bacterium]MCP4832149.1 3-deoxy-manno-octulosonate cytidylyltransferase [Gammaproteobacteria bacterium]MCP4928250.1 3-deoxy-manno-octulosonate cytidylyltransferase [Gammaproteobacteria bacterium]
MNQFRIVIPARYDSSRLPGKVLLEIAGKPMIQHVWERAVESGASQIIIATDSEKVTAVAQKFGAKVCMTSVDCDSGTDRVAEVCAQLGWTDEIPVVNVQGDAPLIPPKSIQKVAALLLDNPAAAMSTLCVALRNRDEYLDPNVVKVLFDQAGKALYFSRAPIPASGHGNAAALPGKLGWRHLGLYGYRVNALEKLSVTPPCELELTERLEQLRALWLGMSILITVDDYADAPDVDTEDDLHKVEALLIKQGLGT